MATIIPQQNLDPTSQSESGSCSNDSSDSGSESSSSSGSDSELHLLRPIFLKKKQKKQPLFPAYDLNQAALAKADHLQKIELKTVEKVPFDGIDDSDDIDPEQEYLQWKLREAARKKRDADLLVQAELEKEDAFRRKKGIFQELEELAETSDVKGAYKSAKIGAFYNEDLDEKFLKRDYKDVEGREDHSRPTKYKKT